MWCIVGLKQLGLYERTQLDKKKKKKKEVKGFAYFFIMAGTLLQTGKRPVPRGGVGSAVWCLGVLRELRELRVLIAMFNKVKGFLGVTSSGTEGVMDLLLNVECNKVVPGEEKRGRGQTCAMHLF